MGKRLVLARGLGSGGETRRGLDEALGAGREGPRGLDEAVAARVEAGIGGLNADSAKEARGILVVLLMVSIGGTLKTKVEERRNRVV